MSEITLEMSLKPFKQKDDQYIDAVLVEMFQQWHMLINKFDSVAVLLWTADGSELLDYTGEMDKSFEWGKWIGRANEFDGDWNREKDPLKLSPHARRYLYTENPVDFTYSDLRAIVLAIKAVGASVTGKPIRVGTTFDPGPEFSISEFKYHRHPEVCTAGSMGEASFAVSFERLHADSYPYRAFPNGIEEGTSLATLLGAQAKCFLNDMGMDYLWLSNGFGFGAENWAATGLLFDGASFARDSDSITEVRDKSLSFWREFRAACPQFEVQTRGTNLSVGIDFASDGCSLKGIYEGGFDIVPPPNSPWAALDKNFGLEIVGYLSRISELPAGKGYMYRYYLHDPWWINSPWFDRYEGEPHDIYLPLSLSRMNEEGEMETPSYLNLLTVDTSYGEMPDEAVATVTPHIMRAWSHVPDALPPFLWVYPFDDYQTKDSATDSWHLQKPFFEDWFMVNAVNNGLPLPGVVSERIFDELVQRGSFLQEETVLYVPVPRAGSRMEKALLSCFEKGGSIVLYGSLSNASDELCSILGLARTTGIAGNVTVRRVDRDFFSGEVDSRSLFHDSGLSDGDIDTIPCDSSASKVVTWIEQGGERRAYTVVLERPAERGALRVVWTRGTNDHRVKKGANLLEPYPRSEFFSSSSELRTALSYFGYQITFGAKQQDAPLPVLSIHRNSNAFYFSGYDRDATVSWRMRFPLGVPVMLGHEVAIENGIGTYHFPRAWSRECRVFVQQRGGVVSLTEYGPVSVIMRRRVLLEGLRDATIYVFPEGGRIEKCELLLNSVKPNSVGEPFVYESVRTPWGPALTASGVTGRIMISSEFDDVNYLEEGRGHAV